MTGQWILLPEPQRVERLEGSCVLPQERFVQIAGSDMAALLRVGSMVRDALAVIGPRWEITAARGSDSTRLGAVVQVDPAQTPRPEGYRLWVRPDQIRIAAHDAAGAFYAAMTLRQLARQCAGAGELPCLYIEDWPDFPNRGVMLDISRDRVPTMETLYMLVDMLAEWKVNQFQLYMEHTFAYRNHRAVWENASPMTGEQVMALDAYCRERFIELVPNQNSFGHMERWLNHPRYIHLAESPEGFPAQDGWYEGPFSLCPLEPGSLELLAEMYDELLPHFSSRQFNVGCDETYELGQGKSKAACATHGVGRVYLDFLLKIHRLVQRHGRTMQFWGDIVQNHPELIPELPGDIIALEWGYEADHRFAERGARLAQAGVPFYLCPSAATLLSIAGRTENAIGNLRSAAENGLRYGAIGILNTDWGDQGHWQHLPASFLGFAYGAALSWATKANADIDLPRALDVHVFQDTAGVMGRLAYDLGNAYRETGVLIGYQSALAYILLYPDRPIDAGRLKGLTLTALEQTSAYLDAVVAPLPEARIARPDAGTIIDEFWNAAALLRHACHLGMARFEAEDGAVARIRADVRAALADDLEAIISPYRRLWLARSRQGGLADSVRRMERLLHLYRSA